jgi:hypothetical protein
MPKVGDYAQVEIEDLDFSEEVTVKTASGTKRMDALTLARLALVIGSFEATVNLAAGEFVNLFLSGGVLKARLADADDTTKPAHGFVRAAVTSGNSGKVYGPGAINDQLIGLTIGETYWLSTTAGAAVATTPPATTGNGNQALGLAKSATELLFQPGLMNEAP